MDPDKVAQTSAASRKPSSGTVCILGGASVRASRLLSSLAPPNCTSSVSRRAQLPLCNRRSLRYSRVYAGNPRQIFRILDLRRRVFHSRRERRATRSAERRADSLVRELGRIVGSCGQGCPRSCPSDAMRKKPAHQVVAEKRQWHHQPTAEEQAQGFKGWYSRGYLPHFDAPGTWQFITYRLVDSIPAELRHEWVEA